MTKIFLFNIETSVEVKAETEEEALSLLLPQDGPSCRVIDQDVMLVDVMYDGEIWKDELPAD